MSLRLPPRWSPCILGSPPAWTWLLLFLTLALGSKPVLAQPPALLALQPVPSAQPPAPSAGQPPAPPAAPPAAQPPLPLPTDPAAFDRLVVDTLRDVHNLGAELYNNSRDYAGTYRLYHGALLTVRPLLSHRPPVQQRIDLGLQEVEREPTLAHKAFRLHVVIEDVRSELKKTASAPKPPEKKPQDKPPLPPEKKPQDKPPLPPEKKSPPPPPENKLPPLPVAPPPRPALK
ncbi:MAG: hypothetical protein WHU94_10465 [Thermogemmata sp.]|uniref:Uncharacterized protein n=1 Tax=Thermogemmata fonticola TaxID=2755323 RepID=A0A7V8VDQ9_9BACT|nr:hypothetical protein [Thermogemmata fonticola]MBA2226140.1 hypothetical protein [Thermogemmata fonticola]